MNKGKKGEEETKEVAPIISQKNKETKEADEFKKMAKLNLEPVGAFGFNSECLPYNNIMTLKAIRKNQTRAAHTIAEKRVFMLNYIKRNMLSLVHSCSSSEKKPLPHVLMAYSVGRRSVITNTFQKSNAYAEEENEEAANKLEDKLREGIEFIDPNASKCEIVSFLE
jgi:hypothetical protein